MRSKTVQWGCLLAILTIATVLRVYDLQNLPAGLFCDEAGLGYNAHAIATAGIDERGNRFPLFFWSFGVSYKNPVYVYATAAVVKLFGLNEFTTRLPAALFGVGTVAGIFFLGRALLGAWAGLGAALLLAVCPWHLHFSRIGFELISFPFLFVIGCTLLVRFAQGRRSLPAAMVFLGLCVYAYAIANIFVPLFLLGFAALYSRELLRRWREALLALVVLCLTVGPAAWFLYQRHNTGTQYFRNTTFVDLQQDMRPQLDRFGRNYRQFFSRSFLLENGDRIVRHAVRGHGELLPIFAPLMLLGSVVLALRRERAGKMVLWWLILYPVGASLMTEIPSASRGIIGTPAFCLLAAAGLAAILRGAGWVARFRPLAFTVQAVLCLAVLGVVGRQEFRYLLAYFVDYPRYSAPTYGGFQYGYGDMIHYMESERHNYDLLMMTAVDVNQPQIFPLFYNQVDPRQWLARHDTGYVILDPAEYGRYSMDQRILAALRPKDLQYFSDYTVKREIIAPGGQKPFVIAEVRKRRRFLLHWLGLGLFDNERGKGVGREFIDVRKPLPDHDRSGFGDVSWRPITQQFVRVDLNRFFVGSDPRHPRNPEWVCAYAATTIMAPRAQSAFLELAGSDDRAQVWLNGYPLTYRSIALQLHAQRRAIELGQGRNLLLLKSCETVGGWWFTVRIADETGDDVPGLETIAELPPGGAFAKSGSERHQVQLVEGFQKVVDFRQTRDPYPDYRGGMRGWWAVVRDEKPAVTWMTRPCPKRAPTVVVFTASLSNQVGEARLFVNDKYALSFQTGGASGTRRWQEGPYRLTFESKKQAEGNSGVMFLSVPASDVTAGRPLKISVQPYEGDSNAWFMIKSYLDTIAYEHLSSEMAREAILGDWGPVAEK